MNTDDIKAVAAFEVNRRRLLQGLGVAAGATALGLSPSDPVYAATAGYESKTQAEPSPTFLRGPSEKIYCPRTQRWPGLIRIKTV